MDRVTYTAPGSRDLYNGLLRRCKSKQREAGELPPAKSRLVLTACPHGMYHHDVRRILAVALLAVFSFSLIDPAVFASNPESKLPSCCRRAGKHHCAMTMGETGPSIQASKCRSFPEGRGVTALPNSGLLRSFQAASISFVSCHLHRPSSDTLYRVSFCSTCQKRGPPVFFLS
jgi:hypothetical protein